MNTNIFIPSKINVGFQNRKGTYTGKLAYVIYFDEKGKLRKETSWQSWRDENIPNEIYDNEPTEGFVLNKKVGGVEESWGWDARRTYTRVYDPRGFEFEITIPNLLWILENCNCIKGKGLEGEFVYGWDGKDLVLVPVESPDYKEIQEKNRVIHNNEFIKAKELIIGATYKTLNGEQYVYMGKFDKYEKQSNWHYDYSRINEGWAYPLDNTWIEDKLCSYDYRYRFINKGKHFFFIQLGNQNSPYSARDYVTTFKSVTRKFSEVVNEKHHEKYIDFVHMLNNCSCYSPINYNKSKIITLPFENFVNVLNNIKTSCLEDKYSYGYQYFGVNCDDKLKEKRVYYDKEQDKFYYKDSQQYEEIWWGTVRTKYKDVDKYFDSIEELYKSLNPVYGEYYLENNNLYEREYYYE